jgi:hypothetical protein
MRSLARPPAEFKLAGGRALFIGDNFYGRIDYNRNKIICFDLYEASKKFRLPVSFSILEPLIA